MPSKVDMIANDDGIPMYSEWMSQEYFLGLYPFSTILENINDQFRNYMTTDDLENYVEIFYNQLSVSYQSLRDDESEEWPEEARDLLRNIHDTFINEILDLFYERLGISFPEFTDSGIVSIEDEEFMIYRAYEYFILNARNNFKTVISTSINGTIPLDIDDQEYFNQLQSLMENFSPLIQIDPVEFIQYTGNKDIYELYNNFKMTGNFLQKYTPKLYENEIFAIEVVNYTTMVRLFEKERENMINNNEGEINNGL